MIQWYKWIMTGGVAGRRRWFRRRGILGQTTHAARQSQCGNDDQRRNEFFNYGKYHGMFPLNAEAHYNLWRGIYQVKMDSLKIDLDLESHNR